MLKIFRQHTKVIIWIVVGSFILWGGYSASALKKEGRFAGEVFGKSVTFQEYNQFYRATQLFMPSEEAVDNPDLLRDYTWQNIIYSREAKKDGIKITDEEVRGEVSNILKQQGLTAPTQDQYRTWLTRSLRMSPRDFEEGLREFMRIQKLLRVKIVSFTPAEAAKLTDEKDKEASADEQKTSFMLWTNDVNKRANLKDYLAPSPDQGESLGILEEEVPVTSSVPDVAPVPAPEPESPAETK